MSHGVCTITDASLYPAAKRMYVDLGAYRYGLTVVGEGKPLVCLHGFSESGYTWDSIVLPGYRMIRIDTIGHGDSDIPDDAAPYTIPYILRDLHAIIHCVAGDSYALMGYSMGARLALLYALEHERDIEQLILESGSAGIASDVERRHRIAADETLADEIESHDGAWFARRWAETPIFDSQKQLAEGCRDRIFRRRAHNSPFALASTLRGSGQGVMPYVGDRLCELTVPGLYVSGALDTKYTTIGRDIFGVLPNFHHVIVEGAGHTVHLEQPQAFLRAVLAFLHEKGYVHEQI